MRLKNINLLLLEDNPGDVRIIREMLKESLTINFKVAVAENLAEAEQKLANENFDVILSDLNLPDSSGLATLNKLLQLTNTTPIIILTGVADDDIVDEAVKNGAEDYLVKGEIDKNVCIRSIKYAIDRHIAKKQLIQSENRSSTILENNVDGILVLSKGGLVRYVNPTAEKLLNKNKEQIINKEFGFPIDSNTELTILGKDKNYTYVEMNTIISNWENEEVFIASLRDVTINKINSDKIVHLNKLLNSIRNINQLIVTEKNCKNLINKACQSLIDNRSYDHAWIVLLDEQKQIYDYSLAGRNGYSKELEDIFDNPADIYCINTLLYDDKHSEIIFPDVKCENCSFQKLKIDKYSIVARIQNAGRIYGIINVSRFKKFEHDNEERVLIQDVADDLALALHSIENENKRKEAALEIEKKREVFKSLFNISQMTEKSEEEIIDYAIEEAVKITDSEGAYLHFMNEDKVSLNLFKWSENVNRMCNAEKISHYPLEIAGIWADCIRSRKPVIHNNYPFIEDRKGLPEGHFEVKRHMSIPVFDGDKIVAVGGVGNKKTDYTEEDVLHLKLYMNEMWKVLIKKRGEIKIKESEEKYRLLAENSVDVIWKVDTKLRFTYVNPASHKVFGYYPEELIGTPLFKYTTKKDFLKMARVAISFIKQLNKEKSISFESNLIHKKGKLIPIEISGNSLVNENGKVIGLQGITRDITERYEAERKLKESEKRFRSIYENAEVGIYRINKDGELVMANPAFLNLVGVSEFNDIEGNKLIDLGVVKKESRVEYKRILFDEGTIFGFESKWKRLDGKDIIIHESAKSIYDEYDNILFYEGVAIDVTQQKEAQERLVHAKEKAEEMSRLKSMFLANMSHELRTPLVGILGFAEMLSQEIKDESQIEMSELILESGKRLLETLNSILDLSKIEANKLEIHFTEINIIPAINTVIKLYQASANKKGLDLKLETVKDEIVCRLDENLFRQVISNLINNAIKFTDKGKIEVLVDIEKQKDNNWVVVSVEDTGIGIKEESLNLIFKDFRQVSEGMSRYYEGTGLGLSIAQKFVKKMNGEISVKSKFESGSKFIVKFPVLNSVSQEQSEQELLNDELNVFSKNIEKKKDSILVVDDDDIARELTTKFLEKIYKVRTAKDPQDAIASLKENNYSLILMDINLKNKISGLDLTKKIKNMPEYAGIPIIAYTAFAMVGDKERFLSEGCDGYISKPFTKNDLLELIDNILSNANN